MPDSKPRRPRSKPLDPQPRVHRRQDAPRGLRQLPDDFQALAHGEKPRRRPPKPALHDERQQALVPGVANRDARAVCDARIERMLAARDSGDRAGLEQALSEAFRMGLWRGRNLIGFDALLEDVLGLRVSEGRALAEQGAKRLGSTLVRASDRAVATWFRAEAALLPSGSLCRVELHGTGEQERFVVTTPAEHADLWLAEVGKRVVALSKFLPRQPAPRGRNERR